MRRCRSGRTPAGRSRGADAVPALSRTAAKRLQASTTRPAPDSSSTVSSAPEGSRARGWDRPQPRRTDPHSSCHRHRLRAAPRRGPGDSMEDGVRCASSRSCHGSPVGARERDHDPRPAPRVSERPSPRLCRAIPQAKPGGWRRSRTGCWARPCSRPRSGAWRRAPSGASSPSSRAADRRRRRRWHARDWRRCARTRATWTRRWRSSFRPPGSSASWAPPHPPAAARRSSGCSCSTAATW
jgi:hypothetical protein